MGRNILVCIASYFKSLLLLSSTPLRLTPIFVSLCSFLGGALFITALPAYASAVPGGNIADANVRAVDLAKPAVVRIITTIGGRIVVRFPAGNAPVSFPQNGGNYDIKVSGSGTFISSSGDIITADHVIKPPQDQALDTALEAVAAQDIADYVNQHYATSTTYTKSDVVGALDSGYFLSQKSYTGSTSEVYLSTDYTGPLSVQDLQALPDSMHAKVDKILKESAVDEKDMAIIHVKMTNTPSVQFGDSSQVAQQDNLTIIGFPGNGDISERKDPTTFLTSSINKIFVSALKRTDSGADVIQVGGNVEHGDSGGPALDANGNIVGIVSFGLEATPPYGSTFLQTSNNAKSWLSTLGLDTHPGSMQRAWQQAFADYTSTQPGHWHKAQGDFRKLAQSYPGFKATTPFLTYTNHEAQREPATQLGGKPLFDYTGYLRQNALLLSIIGALILALLLLAGWTAASRRRKPALSGTLSRTPPAYSASVPSTEPAYRTLESRPMDTPGISSTAPPVFGSGLQGQPSDPRLPQQLSDPRLQRQQSTYDSGQRREVNQVDWAARSKEQDVIPTQPLRRDVPEHEAASPYEP